MQDWFKRFRELSAAVRDYHRDPSEAALDRMLDAAGMPARSKQPTVDVRELIKDFET